MVFYFDRKIKKVTAREFERLTLRNAELMDRIENRHIIRVRDWIELHAVQTKLSRIANGYIKVLPADTVD